MVKICPIVDTQEPVAGATTRTTEKQQKKIITTMVKSWEKMNTQNQIAAPTVIQNSGGKKDKNNSDNGENVTKNKLPTSSCGCYNSRFYKPIDQSNTEYWRKLTKNINSKSSCGCRNSRFWNKLPTSSCGCYNLRFCKPIDQSNTGNGRKLAKKYTLEIKLRLPQVEFYQLLH